MKKLISIILLLNILRFKYIEYRITVKEENKIITKETTNEEKYLLTLEIPKIKLKRKIYNLESKNNNVNKNIELLKPFIEPSNKNGIIILAGHNGNSNVSYFNKLYKLTINDNIIIEYKQKKYVYQIVNIYDILKTGKALIKTSNYNNIIVLITCKGRNKQTIYIASLIS